MSVDKLRQEQMEYTLRIEEVLSGVDRVLTDLANRVSALERKVQSPTSAPAVDAAILERLLSLEEQVSTMGLALGNLMGDRR